MFNFSGSSWIWKSDGENVNDYVKFKKTICISEINNDARIYLSVDTDYVLYINDVFVNCGQFQFGKNKFSVDTLEIGNYLKIGDNSIEFLVHYQGVATSQYAHNTAGLIFKIECGEAVYFSDETTKYISDSSYFKGDYYKITHQLGFNFLYDASINCDGNWKNSNTRDIQDENFVLRPIKKCEFLEKTSSKLINHGFFKREDESTDIAQMMQTDYLSSAKFRDVFCDEKCLQICNADITGKEQDGIYLIYDLGKEEVGHFYLDVEAKEGTIIDFSYGEHLTDLRVRAKIANRNFANRYICKDGKQHFCHRFTRLACRYIQIHIQNYSENTQIIDVGLIPMQYPVATKGEIIFNDKLYEKINEIAVRTLHICMHEHYEDTPWREQALYAMDSRNQALFGYYCFGEYDFPKASFSLLGESMREDCFLSITAPSDTKLTIPYFTYMWIVELNDYLMYTGDIEFAKTFILQIEKIINTHLKNAKNGVPCIYIGKYYWNFYDWADGLSGEGEEVSNGRIDILYELFLILAMQSYQNMAKYCDNVNENYENDILKLQGKINEVFWNENDNLYATYSFEDKKYHYCELVQALALITNTCKNENENSLREKLASDNDMIKTTISHSIFKLQALMQSGEQYIDVILKYIEKTWGNMLFCGATSFWETELGESDFNGAGSLSHAWSSVPIYVFYAYLLGIKPIKPGEFSCNPISDMIKNPIKYAHIGTKNGQIRLKVSDYGKWEIKERRY